MQHLTGVIFLLLSFVKSNVYFFLFCLSAKLNSSIREIFKKMDFSNTVN
jgi:hypothetical protein